MTVTSARVVVPFQRRPEEPVRPVPGIRVSLSADGRLHLTVAGTAASYECGHESTAIWIALQHQSGLVTATSMMLAQLWDADPSAVRAAVLSYVATWRGAGMLRH